MRSALALGPPLRERAGRAAPGRPPRAGGPCGTREIEEQYLRPALASIEKSRAVRLEAPSYLDGLVAFYRKDYEGRARARAEGA